MATVQAPRSELPCLDTSPDVYETFPDDDTTASTAGNRSSPPTPAEASDTSADEDDDDDDGDYGGVSRRRLHVSGARLRFREQSRRIETKGADMSDRVDGRRKGYRVKRGGVSRDEDETLEARIARLRREVEECRVEAEAERKQKQQQDTDGEDGEDGGDSYVDATEKLCEMLAETQLPEKARRKKGQGHGRNQSETVFHDAPTTVTPDTGGSGGTEQHTLARVSAFDERLAALEAALGMASLDSVTEADATVTPLLPTLTLLDQQLASLTTATSLSSLEQAISRIQKLKSEAHNLAQLQRAAVSAKSTPVGSDDEESEAAPLLSSDDMKRLEALYTLLPALHSLSPTVPALITRLRSLRTLHTAAANASQDLEDIESRQAEMDKELKMWREGLQKVEEAVRQHGEANGRNGNFVKGWVEDLEGRVQALGR